MDCGAIRSILSQSVWSEEQEERLAAHLATCAACADDEADALGHLLRRAALTPVPPPAALTASIMARLPAAAPHVLYAREQQQQRWRRALAGLGLLTVAVALLLICLWQGVAARSSAAILATWGGSATNVGHFLLRLTLVSKTILQGGTAVGAVLLLLVVLAGVLSQRLPTARVPRLVVATVIGLGLSIAVLVRVSSAGSSGDRQTIHTIRAPITVASGAGGDVLSLFGDIQVAGHIRGDVATIAGRVILAPGTTVDGSVLSGAGTVPQSNAVVGGAIIDGAVTAPAQVVPGPPDAVGNLTQLGGLLLAFVTFVLAALWFWLQPERFDGAGDMVRRTPVRALGVGLGATVVLQTACLAASVLLAATLFGTVVIPLVLLGAQLPYLRGLAVVGQVLGYLISHSDAPVHTLWGIALQAVLVMALVLMAPLAGVVVFYVLGSAGLGAALLATRRPHLSF